jgi:putative membrane protein
MELRAREHVPALTVLLTAVSLGLVFGAALRLIPGGLLPRASDGVLGLVPHVNAVVSTAAILTIAAGVLAARRGEYRRHRRLMLASLALFAAFLVLYLYKVILEGPAPFPGPESLYRTVYLPTLGIHILLAVVCIPLLYYVVLLAVTRPIAEVFETRHRRVARVAAALWVVSFVLGNAVYAMLYLVPW